MPQVKQEDEDEGGRGENLYERIEIIEKKLLEQNVKRLFLWKDGTLVNNNNSI